MSHSVARNLIHLVFSTKYREPFITGALNPSLFAYVAGAANAIDCPAVIAGGVADHVHILFALNKTVALCKAVEEIKKQSSKWAKENGGPENFYWQNGYGRSRSARRTRTASPCTLGTRSGTTRRSHFRTSFAGCCTWRARSATSAPCGIEDTKARIDVAGR